MSFDQDIAEIERIVKSVDVSIREANCENVDSALRELDDQYSNEAFLLAAMRTLALAKNGHTRIIPNQVISLFPLRFVAIGKGIYQTSSHENPNNRRLMKVNGTPVSEIQTRLQPYLAGNSGRQAAIGAMLFAWPAAMQAINVLTDDAVTYEFTNGSVVRTAVQSAKTGSKLYPTFETGTPLPDKRKFDCRKIDGALLITLPSFGPNSNVQDSLATMIKTIGAHPDCNIILDLRGNQGGNFFLSLPLIDYLEQQGTTRTQAILVDKFTFSAAIVFVAIARARLGNPKIIGEEMGDTTRFYAEGDTLTLPQTGALLRYSTAFHDWQDGTFDATTPDVIVQHLVAAGDLRPDVQPEITLDDLQNGRDACLEAALSLID